MAGATVPPMSRAVGAVRYVVIVAVLGVLAQALITYGWAVGQTVDFIRALLTTDAADESDTIVDLLQVLDLYLIGTVLVITAVGLYELFIADVDLPEWLVIRTFSDLKTKIVEVLVLVIGIKFLEKAVTTKEGIDVLWVGLGSAAVMAVLVAWNVLKPGKDQH
jgi:uncharacterized membrane protein YqhA